MRRYSLGSGDRRRRSLSNMSHAVRSQVDTEDSGGFRARGHALERPRIREIRGRTGRRWRWRGTGWQRTNRSIFVGLKVACGRPQRVSGKRGPIRRGRTFLNSLVSIVRRSVLVSVKRDRRRRKRRPVILLNTPPHLSVYALSASRRSRLDPRQLLEPVR